jgi:Putative prokaryotic signal transducing protein
MGDLLHPTETEQDEAEDAPIDPGDFALVFQADDQMQAHLLVSACEEAGIPALLHSPRSGVVGTIASPVEGFHILVPQRDVARAKILLEERNAALEADPDGAARAAEAEEAAGEKS